MADYSISAEITADSSKFNKGVNKAEKSLKSFSKGLADNINKLGKNGLVGAMANVSLATGGVALAFGAVVKVAKKVGQAVSECTQAYRVQYQAELALETAVKNNPYVDGTASNSLKAFASEMQSVTDIGDEQFLPMMAQLIATGRTEAETMDIIRVATDMSATGTMSFETAIQQLNGTINGNIGRLGMQNAELKSLTEEELRSGKAVEILGEKFKGLASATADTSKQLKNAIGDLKENLGKIFETALAPMRKFFTEVITNLNNSITKSRELKGAIKEVFTDDGINVDASTSSMQIALNKVLEQQREATKNYAQYLSLYGEYIDEATDETARAYREQISDLNKQIKQLAEELNKRKRESDAEASARKKAEASAEEEKQINDLKEKYLKLIAEQEAKWANIKKVTGEAVKNEERLKFYQEQLVAIMTESGGKITENNQYYKDQMAIIQGILAEIGNPEYQSEWASKLLDQRIEMLETEKDMAIQNAEETGEETYSIYQYYNDRLLELRLERLQNEKENALKEENLTEEDKIKIDEYYANEEKKIYNSLNDYKAKKRKQEVKQEENKFADILTLTMQYAKKTADTFSKVFKKVVSTIGKFFSGIGNIFKKLFSFNVDDALNNLLAFEDSILTFFIETLPQLPKFFASAVESIIHLIQTIFTSIDFGQVADILSSIIKSIGTLITNIAQTINQNADKIISGFTLLVKTVIQGIANWINSGGWRELLKAILVIQKTIETAIADNMEELAKTISAMLPDLIQFLIDSIVSASKTLGKIAKTLLPLIAKLINAIIEVITSDEVIEASIEAIEGIVEGLIPAVIDLLVKAIPKIINFFLFKLPSYTPKLIIGIVKGLIKGFSSVNWGDVVYEIFYGFVEAVKDMFGIHSPSTLFEGFGFNMVEGLVNGLKGIAEAVMIILQPVINVIQSLFNGLFNFISDVIGKILNAVTSINRMSFDTLEKVIGGLIGSIGKVSDSLTAITQISFGALNTSIVTLLNSLTKITELSFGAVFDLANISFVALKTTLNSISRVLNTISTTAVNLVDVSFKGLKDVIESIGNSVANMTNSVTGLVNALKDLVEAVNKGMSALNPFSGGGSSGGGSSKESTGKRVVKAILSGGLTELFHWATGTNNAPSGLAVVGEAGPELVRFNGGEQVLNTRNTQKALEGMGGTSNTFNVNFTNVRDTSAYALVSQLKQYNRQLSINGIL